MIYTPNVNFEGTDSFTFKGNDGNSDSNTSQPSTITVGNTGGGGDKTAPDRQAERLDQAEPRQAEGRHRDGAAERGLRAVGHAASLNVPGASKSFKLSKASANAAANAKVKLRLKISSKAVKAIRKAVKKHKRVKASISIIAKDAAGNSATFKRTVRAKAK